MSWSTSRPSGTPATGCSVALTGPGKWSYVYGRLTDQDAPEILAGAAAYASVTIGRERLANDASARLEDVLRDVAGFQQFRRTDSRSANPTSPGATLRSIGGNASSRALVLLASLFILAIIASSSQGIVAELLPNLRNRFHDLLRNRFHAHSPRRISRAIRRTEPM